LFAQALEFIKQRPAADAQRAGGFRAVKIVFAERVQHGLALDFLPSRIAEFQQQHPKVLFDLKVMDHERALATLTGYEADLALVFRPAMWPTISIDAMNTAKATKSMACTPALRSA